METDTTTNQLNLWIINHYAVHPVGSSGGTRHYSLAHSLKRYGWNTTIFAASTAHSTRKQRPDSTFTTQSDRDISWIWLKCPNYHKHAVMRLANMAVFTAQVLLPKATRTAAPPSVVIGSSVHPFAAWAAYRLAKRHRVPFVFEVRDLWPETLIQMGALKRNGVPARLMRSLELTLYRKASLILTTMPYAYRYIETLGVTDTTIAWVPNGTEIDSFERTPAPLNSTFNFLYYGAHGKANNLGTIIDAFSLADSQLPDNSISFTFIGNGPLKTELERKAASLGLARKVQFRDAVPKSEIPRLAGEADALVISVLPLALYKYGISQNKLSDYLASHRPILICGQPANNPVRDAGAGICVESNNPKEIADAMIALSGSSPRQRDDWGQHGYDHAAARYSYSALGGQLSELLKPLAQSHTDGAFIPAGRPFNIPNAHSDEL